MTKLFVLGLLSHQEMSGYDIQQRLIQWEVSAWGEVLVGSIYHALKKLEQERYIQVSSMESTGHRQKAIYRITEEGKQYLSTMIKEALSTSSVVYPKTLYSGLAFPEILLPENMKEALQRQEETLEKEYLDMERALLEKRKAINNEVSPILELIFDDMLETIRRRRDFVKKLMGIL